MEGRGGQDLQVDEHPLESKHQHLLHEEVQRAHREDGAVPEALDHAQLCESVQRLQRFG